jgi:DNA-directed RNA polymerase subunit B'
MTEVYLNHKYLGDTDDAKDFVEQFRGERRKGAIDSSVSAHYDEAADEVKIESTKGRAIRPMIVVKYGIPLLTEAHLKQLEKGEMGWNDLVSHGIIEYLDAAEEENTFIALSKEELTSEHTHLEISPSTILGLVTSLVPYANYGPGARINMGSKNQKQAIGLYASNYPVRMDTDVNILHYPQISLVSTMMSEITEYAKHPVGQNVTIAVLSYEGYNMEDAVVINKASIERGLSRSTYYRPSIAEELRYAGGLIDEICIPDKEVKGYKSEHDYRMLEKDGIISPEAVVNEGDVIIGKTSPPRFLSSLDEYNLASSTRRESSAALRHGEKGVVDFVLLTENEEGNKLIQVRVREDRTPEVGDKFTSRYGQKGVVGLIVPQSDMPYTASGMIPDLLFSPHGIPSRMTISHLIEIIGGKVGAMSGRYIDGTIFNSESEESLRKELVSLGFRENGTETMYNGQTGEMFKAKIYVGNMYYLKLKHMVANKIHSRARGPIQLLTRQPTEGRAKEGGLRLGEMEKDTFVAHGASLLLKERFDSDKTKVPVCEQCGIIAVHDEFKNKSYCPICGEGVEITHIELSYAFKLILDELKSICIYPKIQLKNKY